MKRCPSCGNTFDDSMRFCQLDGTPLADDAGSAGLSNDHLKTVIGGATIQDSASDVSPFGDEATKTLFSPTDFQSGQTPFDETQNNSPSLFGDSYSSGANSSFFSNESPSTSSPFDSFGSQTAQPQFSEPQPFNPNSFDAAQNQFGQPLEKTTWTPPPAPDAGWQSQNIGANTPFQPPMIGRGQNQTLPIVSLVLGIVSIFCCFLGFLTGPAALITGYIGKKNADTNPNEYGGGGMALAGMILGGVGTLISIGYFLLTILGAIGGSFR